MEAEKPVLVSKVDTINGIIMPLMFGSGACFGFYKLASGTYELYIPLILSAFTLAFLLFTRWCTLSIYSDRLFVKYLLGTSITISLNDIILWEEVLGSKGSGQLFLYTSDGEHFAFNKAVFRNYEELKAKLTQNKPMKAKQISKVHLYAFLIGLGILLVGGLLALLLF